MGLLEWHCALRSGLRIEHWKMMDEKSINDNDRRGALQNPLDWGLGKQIKYVLALRTCMYYRIWSGTVMILNSYYIFPKVRHGTSAILIWARTSPFVHYIVLFAQRTNKKKKTCCIAIECSASAKKSTCGWIIDTKKRHMTISWWLHICCVQEKW